MRTTLKDEQVKLVPPLTRNVEELIAYMGEDEMLEVTPLNVRLRKAVLGKDKRKVLARDQKNAKKK